MNRKLIYLKCVIILIMCTITFNITAQRVSLDSLDSAQLKHQMDKAIKMRNTGMGLVLVPPVFGIITGLDYLFPDDESETDIIEEIFKYLLFWGVVSTAVPLMITGGIIWAVGSTRIDRIDIALKKFNMMPENSMALGVGITFNLRF